MLLEKAYAKAHGSYEGIDGGIGRYATVDLCGGQSKSVRGLLRPEVSAIASVARLEVHRGHGEPVGTISPATELSQLPFQQRLGMVDHDGEFPLLFAAFQDGAVIGGQFPTVCTYSFAEHWGAAEYQVITSGSYTVDESTAGGRVDLELSMVCNRLLASLFLASLFLASLFLYCWRLCFAECPCLCFLFLT